MIVPTFQNNKKLPTFQCSDKGLEHALNLLARSIEGIVIPDVRLPQGSGTMEWDGKNVLLRPQSYAPPTTKYPWYPIFHAGETDTEVSFSIGTINNVVPGNWSAKHVIGTLGVGVYKYVTLTVTTASGAVSGATISLEDAPVTTDAVTKNLPPTEFQLVLGVIWDGGFQMVITQNLQALASVVFVEEKASVGVGELAYDNWYRWQVSQIE